MADLTFTHSFGAEPPLPAGSSVQQRLLDCPSDAGTAISDLDTLLNSHGLRLDSRAKCASGTIYHWVRVVEVNGREIVSSGGWYEREEDAIRQAIEMLPSIACV